MKAGTEVTSAFLVSLFKDIKKRLNALNPNKIQSTTGQFMWNQMYNQSLHIADLLNVSANQFRNSAYDPDGTDILSSIRRDVDTVIGD